MPLDEPTTIPAVNRMPSIADGLNNLSNGFDVINQKLENIQATLNSIVLGELPGVNVSNTATVDLSNIDLDKLADTIIDRVCDRVNFNK